MVQLQYIVIIIGISFSSVVYGAGLDNSDFEFGEPAPIYDFNQPMGWMRENYAAIVNNFIPQPTHGSIRNWQIDVNEGLYPYYGQNFVVLSTGDISPDPTYARIIQQVHVEAGWIFSGYYFFGTCDYSPYSDYATIKMVPSDSNTPLRDIIFVNIAVEDVNDYGSMSGWEYFEYTFDADEEGMYDLTLIVNDGQDAIFKSYLAVDHLKLRCVEYGDLNTDCKVDFMDYALLAENWIIDCSQPIHDCSAADLFEDEMIDYKDIAVLAEYWLDNSD